MYRPHIAIGGLVVILGASLVLCALGILSQKPFIIIDVDEPLFVVPALKILATGDYNPHWFGHPGSFTIYCLAPVVVGIHPAARQSLRY
jgi:hypothetical protein